MLFFFFYKDININVVIRRSSLLLIKAAGFVVATLFLKFQNGKFKMLGALLALVQSLQVIMLNGFSNIFQL